MLLLKLAGPAYCIVGFLLAMYIADAVVMNTVRSAANEIQVSAQRSLSAELLAVEASACVLAPLTTSTSALRWHQDRLANITDMVRNLAK